MGFKDTSGKLPIFYNVALAVGKNCPNIPDDVMLIQYLLDWRYKNCQPSARPNGVMKLDGVYGDVTANWILKFQLDILLSGRPILADNRIAPIRDKKFFRSSLSDAVYTLAWLNWIVSCEEPEAFANTGLFVPLQNPPRVPLPSSNNIVIPATPQMKLAVSRF